MKFQKCQRKFDVTFRIVRNEVGFDQSFGELRSLPKAHVLYEASVSVWADGPSFHHLTPLCYKEAGLETNAKNGISILHVREHEFHEYTPTQLGVMAAKEGLNSNDNPFGDIEPVDPAAAEEWHRAYEKEMKFIVSRRR